MEVLRFTQKNNDYEIIIRSNGIDYAWERFKAMVKVKSSSNDKDTVPYAERYCDYKASEIGTLNLYTYQGLTNAFNNKDYSTHWTSLWPVVFETCSYNIAIRFRNGVLDSNSTPEIIHPRKDVVESFYIDEDYNGKNIIGLSGDVNFLNEPGTFKLEFSYSHHNTIKHAWLMFDIVSPKLDTKNDYKSLLRDVNDEYNDIIFKYLTTTFQQLAKGKNKNDIIWIDTFESIVGNYLDNIKMIIRMPHSKVVSRNQSAKVDSIKYWTPKLEDEYEDVRIQKKLDQHYFSYKEYYTSNDTKENQFVKHTIRTIGKRLSRIFNKILKNNQDLSDNRRNTIQHYLLQFKKLERNPFFKSVGKFNGLTEVSMVLQSKIGYQQIYKDWIKLQRGISLYEGVSHIGTLQIWEIYELWCFVKMKRLIKEILHIDKDHPYYESLVTEPKGTLLNPFTSNSLEHEVRYQYPLPDADDNSEWANNVRNHKGDIITLHYQHTFNRRKLDNYGIHTVTTEQRPDIVLNIEKSGETEPLLTYLYDAKYRLVNDKTLDKDIEESDIEEINTLKGGDYPPSDAINQMHRYRDAIYYGSFLQHNPSKEVIGGYILFPGRGDDETISKRYYSESIKKVNIGALPLLPNSSDEKKEGFLLRQQLESIILKTTYLGQIEDSIPQRGLVYTDDLTKDIRDIGSNNNVLISVDITHYRNFGDSTAYAIGMDYTKSTFDIVEQFLNSNYFIITNKNEFRLYELKSKPTIINPSEIGTTISYPFHGPYYKDHPNEHKETCDFYILFQLGNEIFNPNLDIAKIRTKPGKSSYEPRIEKINSLKNN